MKKCFQRYKEKYYSANFNGTVLNGFYQGYNCGYEDGIKDLLNLIYGLDCEELPEMIINADGEKLILSPDNTYRKEKKDNDSNN